MTAALARHDAIVRAAIGSHHGRVVKTTGDGFHGVFARPDDALGAAVEAQRAIVGRAQARAGCNSSFVWVCTPARAKNAMVTTTARR